MYDPEPVTVKAAEDTVPAVAGKVTPPVIVLVPAGAKTTVPAVPATAKLPKFISTVFEMLIGVTIVADAVAVAVACAKEEEVAPDNKANTIPAEVNKDFIYI